MATTIRSFLTVLLSVIPLAITGCLSDDESAETSLAFSELLRGEYSLVGPLENRKQIRVINNQSDLDALYALYSSDGAPLIDFDHHLVVALQMGTHGSSAYRIVVTRVLESDRFVTVELTSYVPSADCAVLTVITDPHQFVLIPFTSKEIIFFERLVADPCL